MVCFFLELQVKTERRKSENQNEPNEATKESKDQTEPKSVDGSDGDQVEKLDDQSDESKATETDAATGSDVQKPTTPATDDQKTDDEIVDTTEADEQEAKPKSPGATLGDDNLIEIEDPDDYLLYLETILMKIHTRFYEFYDESGQVRMLYVASKR